MNDEMSTDKRAKAFVHENGKTYFSKQTERRIFFFMTLAMLVWGVVEGARALG
jgi:hypothetical protein